jgi:hypothetical protein
LEDSIVQYKQIDKNTALLSIELGYSQYYKAELIYNINTKVIQQMNLYPYSELFTQIEEGEISNQITINSGIIDNEIVPERIELIYKSIRFDEDVDSKWFDESKIFKLKDNKIILNSKYQNYEIEY